MPKKEFTTYTIGISVVLTLIVLLAVFLSSEGVKGYNKMYSIVLLVVAAFQILRIFGYPMQGMRDDLFVALDTTHKIGYFGVYPETSGLFFAILLVYLVASAACFIASAVIGWIYAVRLEKFQKALDNGEIRVEATLKAMDAEDATVAETEIKAESDVAEVTSEEVQ